MTLTPPTTPARMAARVTGFGTSIFSEMSRLAREHQARQPVAGLPRFRPARLGARRRRKPP